MINYIRAIFIKEFKIIEHKFSIIDLKIEEIESSDKNFIWHPGVYVFWCENRIIKVGRHLTNSRKRALEHIKQNTRNDDFEMKSLLSQKEQDRELILINCVDLGDYHWVASVEIYLEKMLNPIIKSKRTG